MSLPGNLRNTSNQQLPLAGRAALITGVSRRRGIGFAVARRLAAMGASLFLHSWSAYDAAQPWGSEPDGPHALARDLSAIGVKVESMEADLRSPGAPARLFAAAVQSLGHVDILIANHAYSTSGSIANVTAEEIDAHLQINVRATLLLIKEFAAHHDGRRGGRVVLMTSGQHLEPMPKEIAYVASKGALHQLTKSLSRDLVRRGITVNAINPGATDTGYATPELYQEVLKQEPQGRWGQPEDTARLIGWLVSEDAAWITGEVINSTGGGP